MQANRKTKILFVKHFTPGMALASHIAELGLVEDWDNDVLDSAIQHLEEQHGRVLDEKAVAKLEEIYG